MRNAFVREFTAIAEADRNAILITGDLGFGVLMDFAQKYPRQFINAGVAEQNMTALAVGLALEGKTVFTYSIANFPTLRCLEQIRNDACYHRANVKIVSVGGGFAYGPLGISHHATEDIAIIRALPNITVLSPGDPLEVERATRLAHETQGTCYLRLGRGGEPKVHRAPTNFSLGEAVALWPEGRDVAILCTGGILSIAEQARTLLEAAGLSTSLHSIPSLKPLPAKFIHDLAISRRLVVTVEEHSITGGLGGAVAEVLAEQAHRMARLIRCGLCDEFSSKVGSQEYLREYYGLSPAKIAKRVLTAVADTQ